MPSSRKSNIRSRWYRPNEKPLDSGSNPQKNAEPIGEISSTNNLEFIDDLSNVRPPKAPNKRPQNRNKNSFKKDRSSRNNKDQDRFSNSSNKDKAKNITEIKEKANQILLTTKVLKVFIKTVVEKRNPKTVETLRTKRAMESNPNQKSPNCPPLLQRFLVNNLNFITFL